MKNKVGKIKTLTHKIPAHMPHNKMPTNSVIKALPDVSSRHSQQKSIEK